MWGVLSLSWCLRKRRLIELAFVHSTTSLWVCHSEGLYICKKHVCYTCFHTISSHTALSPRLFPPVLTDSLTDVSTHLLRWSEDLGELAWHLNCQNVRRHWQIPQKNSKLAEVATWPSVSQGGTSWHCFFSPSGLRPPSIPQLWLVEGTKICDWSWGGVCQLCSVIPLWKKPSCLPQTWSNLVSSMLLQWQAMFRESCA